MRKTLDRIEGLVSAILLIATSILVFIQVISRYFFNYSISWSEEISLLMIAWFIFIGCSVAAREGAHVSMEILESILPSKVKKYLKIFINIICMAFCLIIIYAGIGMVRSAIDLNAMATSISLPLWVAYLSVPVGMVLMLIEYMFNIIDSIKDIKRKEVEK